MGDEATVRVGPPPPLSLVPSANAGGGPLSVPAIVEPEGASSSHFLAPLLSAPPRPAALLGHNIQIRETGPSPPGSSESSPRSSRRPQPLPDEALRRIQLLTAEQQAAGSMTASKLSPLSPYATSDLGSSPRSSISVTTSTSSNSWSAFRDYKISSSDADSDVAKDLLSPGMLLSPAPFSPFSDYDSHLPETPGSAVSDSTRLGLPSPSFTRLHPNRPLHFSFDSFHPSGSGSGALAIPPSMSGQHFLLPPSTQAALSVSVGAGQLRERSRSDSDALHHVPGGTHHLHFPSPASLSPTPYTEGAPNDSSPSPRASVSPAPSPSRGRSLHRHHGNRPGPKKPKTALLQKYQEDQKKLETEELRKLAITERIAEEEPMMESPSNEEGSKKESAGQAPGARSSFFGSSLGGLVTPSRPYFEVWVARQLEALESAGLSWTTPLTASGHAKATVTTSEGQGISAMQSLYKGGARLPVAAEGVAAPGPVKSSQAWRRCRSESDVAAGVGAAGSGGYVCKECGQAFALHDRLAKHVASRHRDRSASLAESAHGAASNGPHHCSLCNKSFGRSDMLTRHMRLHTGLKPYACHLCGQSRRDMITRHMRTHSRGADGAGGELLAVPVFSEGPSSATASPALARAPTPRPGSSHR